MLGVRDDVEARRAIALYLENVKMPIRLDNAQAAAARPQQRRAGARRRRALERRRPRVAGGDAARRARVHRRQPEHGSVRGAAGVDPDQAQASLSDFEDAVRADPSNAVAKYDLELVLRTLLSQGVRIGPAQQTGAGSNGQRGAGGGVPGSGY